MIRKFEDLLRKIKSYHLFLVSAFRGALNGFEIFSMLICIDQRFLWNLSLNQSHGSQCRCMVNSENIRCENRSYVLRNKVNKVSFNWDKYSQQWARLSIDVITYILKHCLNNYEINNMSFSCAYIFI